MNKPCFYHDHQAIYFDKFYADISSTRAQIALHDAEHIMLFHGDSYRFTVLFLALILAKKHIVLPPNKQDGTLQKLAAQCDATLGDINVGTLPCIATQTSTPQALSVATSSDIAQLFAELAKCSLANITFFTSGSTGQPKAIVKQWQQLECELNTLTATFAEQLSRSDVVVSTVSHQHIYGLLFKILLPLRLNKTIVNKTFEYPEHIYIELTDFVFQQSPDLGKQILLISSPAHLKRLVLDNVLAEYAAHYATTFSSGGLLTAEVSQLFAQQMDHAPIEVFGSTETGGIAWRCGQQNSQNPWQVFPSIRYLIDEETKRLIIFSEYIHEQPYATDDCVTAIDEQRFILTGRIDRTVKIEEKRVNLDHLEQCLIAHPWVHDAKVFIVKNHKQRIEKQVLSCVLVIAEHAKQLMAERGKRALNNTFKQQLLNDFERICLPKKWRYLDKFPYNSQGKLMLTDLERLFD